MNNELTLFSNKNPQGIKLNVKESYPDKFLRTAVRTGARVAETGLGLPGDIASGGLGLANYATGGRTPTYQDIQKHAYVPPTSHDLKQVSSKLSGGYTDPKNKFERFYDDVISDLTSLAIPGAKSPKSLLRLAGIATAGRSAQRGTEALGFSPLVQAAAQLGTMGVASLVGGRSALNSRMNKSYILQEEATAGKTFSSSKLKKELTNLSDQLSHQDYPASDFLRKRVTHLGQLVESHGDKIPVKEMVEAKKALNSWWGSPGTPYELKKHIWRVRQPVEEFLKDYAKTDPSFAKHFFEAEEIFKGLNNFSALSQKISKVIDLGLIKNPVTKAVLGGLGLYSIGAVKTGIAAAATYGSLEAMKFGELLIRSRVAREVYMDFLKSAIKGSPQIINKNLERLDKEITKAKI